VAEERERTVTTPIDQGERDAAFRELDFATPDLVLGVHGGGF
jgi:hypothetical protein